MRTHDLPRFREVHRHVGVAHQLLGTVAGPVERHAQARGDEEVLAGTANGARRRREPIGEAATSSSVVIVLEQDRELVAAEPGGGVARAELVLEPLRRRDQQLVARGVTEAVVDRLEAVEVEHDDRDRVSSRAWRAIAWSIRSANSDRFASCVSESWNARYRSCRSSRLRSVTSWTATSTAAGPSNSS